MSLLEKQSIADLEVQECPFDFYSELSQTPLHWDEKAGFFICGRFDTVRDIVRDTKTFSNIASQTMDGMRPPPQEVLDLRRQMIKAADTLVTNDPPHHTRIRKMMDNPFAVSNIEQAQAEIRDICEETLNTWIEGDECEFVADYCVPVPLKVIAAQLGVPREMAPKFKAWSDAAVEPLGMMISDERLIVCTELSKEFQDYFVEQLEARKQHPQDDLLGHVVNARDDEGKPFTLEEQISICGQLLVAGNETTTNAMGHGMQMLVEQPKVLAALRDDPSKSRNFVEELLRLESPTQGLFRVVMKDTVIEGVEVPKGSRIMLRWAAANRDPARFECPHEIDLERRNAMTHMAFGAGIHRCLGANLAKEELIQTFALLPTRIGSLSFPEGKNDFTHHPNMLLRGLKSLHINFKRL